ncbi:SIS domain-containing protein [Nonomuraea antimicrobica]
MAYVLEEMAAQVDALGGDVRALHGPVLAAARQVAAGWAKVEHVYVTGSGDSHHAALAAEMAFTELAGVVCLPLSALRLLKYGLPRAETARAALVVGVSASGGHPLVAEALRQADTRGARTLAVTSTAGSPVTAAAEAALVAPLPSLRPCPGLRTYQASSAGAAAVGGRAGPGARSRRAGPGRPGP